MEAEQQEIPAARLRLKGSIAAPGATRDVCAAQQVTALMEHVLKEEQQNRWLKWALLALVIFTIVLLAGARRSCLAAEPPAVSPVGAALPHASLPLTTRRHVWAHVGGGRHHQGHTGAPHALRRVLWSITGDGSGTPALRRPSKVRASPAPNKQTQVGSGGVLTSRDGTAILTGNTDIRVTDGLLAERPSGTAATGATATITYSATGTSSDAVQVAAPTTQVRAVALPRPALEFLCS